ncbi:MAG: redox-regulated ATPase YchF [Calditrichaeota bacterium]|nr:MAG: redox-regulated ATPase YchF [Calditrichota bacterium]MBL1206025.1 redox-regulated ATPase YchF [Calditrichota bacterium]NOG45853.1 redox-regulated ATPase YchF [Calditrichota bacterium]
MEIGIVGLPYSGKSTLFSTLLNLKDDSAQHGKQSAERGVVKVPDDRLEKLTALFNPKKKVNATIEFVKVAGLEGDGSNPQGLPPQFIANVKNVDAMLVMVRDFENDFYPHPLDRIDAKKDIGFINSEFLLSDLAVVETRVEKLEKQVMKIKDEQDKRELVVMKKILDQLEQEKPIREMDLNEDEQRIIRGYQFVTAKPVLYVINISEDKISNSDEIEKEFESFAGTNCEVTSLSAEIEKEIAELPDEDAAVFMEDLGISEPALNKLIRRSYELQGLISFFTVGEDECRAWTIKHDTKAQRAAGAIHSDLEKGFIRAETVHYTDLIEAGGWNACKDKGILRLEGKEYPVKDGDILSIRFNV